MNSEQPDTEAHKRMEDIGDRAYRMALYTSLQEKVSRCFPWGVQVDIAAADPDLVDVSEDDAPVFLIRMQNHRTGLAVEIYRGHWPDCVWWLDKGRSTLDVAPRKRGGE